MGVIAKILTRDLKRILKNPVALIVALGVCILPSLYAWINILANWNPYENTSTVPVAVAVEDEGADITGMGRVDAGAMIRVGGIPTVVFGPGPNAKAHQANEYVEEKKLLQVAKVIASTILDWCEVQ